MQQNSGSIHPTWYAYRENLEAEEAIAELIRTSPTLAEKILRKIKYQQWRMERLEAKIGEYQEVFDGIAKFTGPNR